jgi:hypothetical protein
MLKLMIQGLSLFFSMYSSYGGFVLLVLSTQFQNGLLFYIEAEGHADSVIF